MKAMQSNDPLQSTFFFTKLFNIPPCITTSIQHQYNINTISKIRIRLASHFGQEVISALLNLLTDPLILRIKNTTQDISTATAKNSKKLMR